MKDYIIVGLGLAGLAVAETLARRNLGFIVYEDHSQNSSRVAGGAMNPVILKRFTKFWKAEQFLPTAETFYRQLEEKLKISLLESYPIYRRFHSVREQNDWFTAADKPDLEAYLLPEIQYLKEIPAPYGYGKVTGVSVLDTEKVLDTYRNSLIESKQFVKESFDYKALKLYKDKVSYKGEIAKKIIFCEGAGVVKNPWFNNLPVIGNKGMYLLIQKKELPPNIILKTTFALIPLGGDFYKYGATYDHKYSRPNPEAKDYNRLTESLADFISPPYTILGTQTGIRPTVKDRRPLIGRHPTTDRLLICNGLGAHGVMMAPDMAARLIAFDIEGIPLPKTMDVNRYYTRKKKDLISKF